MLWQLQISMYLFFSVFQLVFWCFNTYPKTSMTWFLLLFFCLFVFFVCFCFLVWFYSLPLAHSVYMQKVSKALTHTYSAFKQAGSKSKPLLVCLALCQVIFFPP